MVVPQNVLNPVIPLGDWTESFFEWIQTALGGLLDLTSTVLSGLYDGLYTALSTPAYLVMMVVFAAIAWVLSGWRMAVFSLVGFYLIRGLDQWDNAMSSLALVLVAVFLALIIAIPLGILAAKSDTFSAVLKPVLDFMQSMPALAYLVPAIVLFSIGIVPGAIATIIFALPPGVRLTELGIRQVNREVVEAGAAFGATPGHILGRIQVPLAMPSIMAGINQVIMLALSMVVLAGMAGAGGLGNQIVGAISRVDIGRAMEAGLAVVILAVFLDRATAGMSSHTPLARAQSAE